MYYIYSKSDPPVGRGVDSNYQYKLYLYSDFDPPHFGGDRKLLLV